MNLSAELPLPDNSPQGIQKLKLSSEEGAKISKLAEQLEDEFETTSGHTAKEALSGTLEDSSRFHQFVFGKTIASPDPNMRREISLAHLALTLDNNETLRVVSPYGDQVGKSGQLLRDIYHGLYHTEQIIPDEAELVKGEQGERLVVSFEDIRGEFGNFTEYYLDMYKLLEGKQLQPNISREQMAAIMATQRIVVEYFGFSNEHSSQRNKAKYGNKDKKVTLADFKGDSSAACTEFTALSQQMLSYAGVRVRLIAGGPMMQADEEGKFPSNPDYEGHVFNIIEGQAGVEAPFIYDSLNPVITRNEADLSNLILKPYLAPMDSEGFKGFLKGNNTVVSYSGTTRMYARV